MKLKVQKRLAAQVLKCSEKKIWFDDNYLEEIKESITKTDIRSLISKGIIQIKAKKAASRGRARYRARQKAKGRRKGHGRRKGIATARLPKKENWMNTVRSQRQLIRHLRDKGVLSRKDYRALYLKSKGGFFRSRRHIRLFMEEKGLAKKTPEQGSKR